MSVKLLTEQHLKFLSWIGGCTDPFESTLVKMPHCWKSRITAQMIVLSFFIKKVFCTSVAYTAANYSPLIEFPCSPLHVTDILL